MKKNFFFKLKSKIGILDHLHKKFDKPKFAQFCKILAKGASDHKDLLCYHLFREAGRILGRHVLAVAKYADKVEKIFLSFSFLFICGPILLRFLMFRPSFTLTYIFGLSSIFNFSTFLYPDLLFGLGFGFHRINFAEPRVSNWWPSDCRRWIGLEKF